MSIKIIPETPIYATSGELARYRADYDRDYRSYSGPMPTFEEYVRRRQAERRVNDNEDC